MRNKRIYLSFLLLFAFILAACGGGAGNAPADEPLANQSDNDALDRMDDEIAPENDGADNEIGDEGQTSPDTDGAEDGDSPFPIMPEPPPAQMIIGDQQQESGVGSYCWQDPAADTAVCADMIGIPTAPTPLVATSPLTAQFLFAIPADPDAVQLDVLTVTPEMESPFSDATTRWWEIFDAERANYSLPLSSDVSQELTLAPGLYVFTIFVRWDSFGDVSYGFLVEVPGAAVDSAPGDSRMGIDTYVQTNLINQDFAALTGVMSDPFGIALWLSEGSMSSPDDAVTLLQNSYLTADSIITFTEAPDMSGLVPDGDVRNVWSPEREIVHVLFSRGWGSDGAGEAFLFITRHDSGSLFWDGMLYAPAGFGAPNS